MQLAMQIITGVVALAAFVLGIGRWAGGSEQKAKSSDDKTAQLEKTTKERDDALERKLDDHRKESKEQLTRMEAKMDKMIDGVGRLDVRMERNDTRTSDHDRRLTTVEADVRAMRNKVQS